MSDRRRPLALAAALLVPLATSACLQHGTTVTVTVDSPAPAGAAPSADAAPTGPAPTAPTSSATAPSEEPPLPSTDRDPTVLGPLRGLDDARATAPVAGGRVVALARRVSLVPDRGAVRPLVRLPGTPLAVAVPDAAARRAVVLLEEDGAPVTRTLSWRPGPGPGRLGEPVAADGAAMLAADGTPVAVDAAALSTSGTAPAVVALAARGTRAWGVVADGGSLRLGVGTVADGAATLAPVTAWTASAAPTALLVTDAYLWVGTEDGAVWRVDVDGERAGNPVGYPLATDPVEALLDASAVLWLSAGGTTVRVDPGTGPVVPGTAAG